MKTYPRETSLREFGEWELIEHAWKTIIPYLKKAAFRLRLNPLAPGTLKNYSDEFLKQIFGPPASPIEEKKQQLAGMIFALLFPEKEIDFIISRALPEIEEAYKVILNKGGGWSSHTDRGADKRMKSVLDWYRHSQDRLSYLKTKYLQQTNLYNPGGIGSQTKRNFVGQLLIEIIKDVVGIKITFQQVNSHLRNLKKFKQSLYRKDV
ncbi:MAG: hypothetical protein FJ134_08550 [Deltaproteobacteria bacterium]|nr:hypothetical protein [Deltaproteobacteria bacterium]